MLRSVLNLGQRPAGALTTFQPFLDDIDEVRRETQQLGKLGADIAPVRHCIGLVQRIEEGLEAALEVGGQRFGRSITRCSAIASTLEN
jgi:hypothetical protein